MHGSMVYSPSRFTTRLGACDVEADKKLGISILRTYGTSAEKSQQTCDCNVGNIRTVYIRCRGANEHVIAPLLEEKHWLSRLAYRIHLA